MMPAMQRRDFTRSLAAAAGVLAVRPRGALAGPRHATAPCELGPFYRRDAPAHAALRTDRDRGLPLALAGVVYDTRGDVLGGATVELWHADAIGSYDIDGDRFRAALVVGSDGKYSVDTIVPGHYSGRVCQHVHFLVRAPGHRPLVTQMFFATDPALDGNPANFTRDPIAASIELVRPVTLTTTGDKPTANVTFDLVLERS